MIATSIETKAAMSGQKTNEPFNNALSAVVHWKYEMIVCISSN